MPDTAMDKKVSHDCPGLCQKRRSSQPEQRYQVVAHHPRYFGCYIYQKAEDYYDQYWHYIIVSVTATHYLPLILFEEHELVNFLSRASCRLLIRPAQRQ